VDGDKVGKEVVENFLNSSLLDFIKGHRRVPTLIRVSPDIFEALKGKKQVYAETRLVFQGIRLIVDGDDCEEGSCHIGDYH
jgi:hypothetical protein